MSMFRKATKTQARLRLSLMGPGGSGKTWTALEVAHHLGKRIAVIDAERLSRLRAELHETRMALVRERVTVSTLIALAEKLREQVARQETR